MINKKITSGIFTFLLNFVYSQTYFYHPFPEKNTVWRYVCSNGHSGQCSNLHCMCLSPSIQVENTNILDSISGDTVIGTYTYKKIMEAMVIEHICYGNVYCQPGYPPTNINYCTYPFIYKGAIRQDSALKKVFIVLPNSNQETLFYDFNLNIGDTLPPSAIFNSQNFFVFSIDSVLVNNNYHKRFWLWDIHYSPPSPPYDPLWIPSYIEGIGNAFGLFTPLFVPFEVTCNLTCVRVDTTTIYPNNSFYCPSLDLTLNINENINNSPKWKIMPNPFSVQTTLKIEPPLKNATLTIFNSYGKILRQIDHIKGDTIVIPRENLLPGVYFFKVYDETVPQSINGKLLITEK